MKLKLEGSEDWAELCTYIDGKSETLEMTPVQYQLVGSLLGFCWDEPYSDEYLTERVLPALIRSMQEIEAQEG